MLVWTQDGDTIDTLLCPILAITGTLVAPLTTYASHNACFFMWAKCHKQVLHFKIKRELYSIYLFYKYCPLSSFELELLVTYKTVKSLTLTMRNQQLLHFHTLHREYLYHGVSQRSNFWCATKQHKTLQKNNCIYFQPPNMRILYWCTFNNWIGFCMSGHLWQYVDSSAWC